MLWDASKPGWMVERAMQYRYDDCEQLKPGGQMVPGASTYEVPKAWAVLGLDTAEIPVPSHDLKLKFLLILDLATKMRKTVVIDRYAFNECKMESAKKVIEAISVHWLQDKPKPQWIVPDSANTFRSKEFREFCEDVGIGLAFPPEKEPWARGEVGALCRHYQEDVHPPDEVPAEH